MENLNKENFWNDVYGKYPNATQEFCNWIDKWKAENGTQNWVDFIVPVSPKSLKFHDYPASMQLGIWFEFSFQQGCGNFTIELTADFDFADDIRTWLKFREEQINDETD